MTTHRIGKYACLEVERRFLLSSISDDLLDPQDGWRITDRYFPATRLRLRHMQSLSGSEEIYKLTQKYRAETQSAYEATITNLYLTQAEYDFLAALDGPVLQKTRYRLVLKDRAWSIDVFSGRHQGLILAETELEQEAHPGKLAPPPFTVKEVTAESFFTGGSLAAMTDEQFQQGLSRLLPPKMRARYS